MQRARKIPRIVRLVDEFRETQDPQVCKSLSYEERQKLKADRWAALEREANRLRARFMARAGFTLVEMLVAVALVVLMMSIFAQIFSMCTSTMATQKGLSENDQRVRMVATLLRGDLKNRTMKDVGPFAAGEDLSLAGNNTGERSGYFYISENDPDDNTDDVLQFTAKLSSGDDPYVGAARILLADGSGYYGPSNLTINNYPPPGSAVSNPGQKNYWQNQPEFDDQIISTPSLSGSSHYAEVSYFLRHGTLFRRVMLIREPSIPLSGQIIDDSTPTSWAPAPEPPGGALSFGPYQLAPATARNFYTDFDFSAILSGGTVQFHGVRDLSPTAVTATTLLTPANRFGHDNTFPGLPREHVNQYVDAAGNVQAGSRFIGRFTYEETSYIGPTVNAPLRPYSLFGYPGKVDPGNDAPNPHLAATNLTYDPTTGKVREYAGGTRIGEDVVLNNVKRFDIKVLDEIANGNGPDGAPGILNVNDDFDLLTDEPDEQGADGSDDGGFVDLGHTGPGFYSAGALQNPTYCPVAPTPDVANLPAGSVKPNNRLYRFDTWNPEFLPGNDPPFRPVRTVPDTKTGLRRSLRAIQIKITFLDPTSQQLRDITIVQSLAEANP